MLNQQNNSAPAGHFVIVGVRTGQRSAPGPTTVIRLLAALRPGWEARPSAEEHHITVHVRTGGPAGPDDRMQLRHHLDSVLQDTALAGWDWTY